MDVAFPPGPDFAATVHRTTTGSRREGVLVGLGVAAGLAIWSVSALVGLALLLATVGWLYDAVRLAGAGYLAYLGLKAIAGAGRPLSPAIGRRGAAWWVGFLTNIGNPKAAIFFGSLFTTLLPAPTPLWVGAAVVALVVGTAAGWYALVARSSPWPAGWLSHAEPTTTPAPTDNPLSATRWVPRTVSEPYRG